MSRRIYFLQEYAAVSLYLTKLVCKRRALTQTQILWVYHLASDHPRVRKDLICEEDCHESLTQFRPPCFWNFPLRAWEQLGCRWNFQRPQLTSDAWTKWRNQFVRRNLHDVLLWWLIRAMNWSEVHNIIYFKVYLVAFLSYFFFYQPKW